MTGIKNPPKNKWKRFAIHHHFSGWKNRITAEQLYERVGNEDFEEVSKEHEIVVWEPYEKLDHDDLVDSILQMAYDLQGIEDEN